MPDIYWLIASQRRFLQAMDTTLSPPRWGRSTGQAAAGLRPLCRLPWLPSLATESPGAQRGWYRRETRGLSLN
ncbi:MAG: hypothetical protein ACHRXM_28505 [Isosphaerales bacterium]